MATPLVMEGFNIKVVQERMEHARASTTMDLYAHALPGMQQRALDSLAGLFDAPKKKVKPERTLRRLPKA